MCTYCMTGDFIWKFDPPWNPNRPLPYVPAPLVPMPVTPWPLDKLREWEGILQRIKELEDRLGCPCEPNKADYLAMFRERIEALEAAAQKLDEAK